MVTTVLLVRHAAHPLLGRILCGRMPGVHLDEAGERQAARLAEAMATHRPAALHSSPARRCLETAMPLGRACNVIPTPTDALDEIEYGAWTGLGFDQLRDDPKWSRWNEARADASPPDGESMCAAQRRAVAWLHTIRAEHEDGLVVGVSHADIIKALLLWCLGLSLDAHHRFDIDPASVSALIVWEGGAKVHRMNQEVAA